MRLISIRRTAVVAGLTLVFAACGGGDTATDDQSTTPADVAPPNAQPSSDIGESTGQGTIDGDLTFSLAAGYSATAIGEGVKPDLELSPDGTPGITFLLEDLNGFIAYASADEGWVPETVVEGYFYGPIGLAYRSDGTANIAYHDHQAAEFDQALGDLTIASQSSDGWDIAAITDDGHDGWDSTIVIGPDDVLRAAGIDPEQFGRTQGVEYFELVDGVFETTEIGTGPVQYEFNVSLAVTPAGNPALTYFDSTDQELRYAERQGGTWNIETVDAEGDVGRYSSLAFDDSGTPHISYLRIDAPTAGTVKYATRADGSWVTTEIDTLGAILTGFTGARRVTDIAIDAQQTAHIIYSDEQVVRRAVASDGGWETSTVIEGGGRLLGQLVSFAIGDDGTFHLSVFEVTRSNPLNGVVAYITD